MLDDAPTTPPEPNATDAPAEAEPFVPYGWLRALLFGVVLFGVVVVQSIMVFVWSDYGTPEEMTTATMDGRGIPIWGFLMAGAMATIWVFRRFLDRRSLVSLGFQFGRAQRHDLLVGLAWGVGLVATTFVILLSLGQISVQSATLSAGPLALTAVTILLAASFEEVVMRGYILNNMMTSMSRYASLVIVSLVFAIAHAANPNVSIVGLVNIVLAGLLLGIYYVHRRNLWFPIGLHFTWNFFLGPVFGSAVSGVIIPGSTLSLEITGSELLTGGEFGFEASLVSTLVLVVGITVLHWRYRPKTTG